MQTLPARKNGFSDLLPNISKYLSFFNKLSPNWNVNTLLFFFSQPSQRFLLTQNDFFITLLLLNLHPLEWQFKLSLLKMLSICKSNLDKWLLKDFFYTRSSLFVAIKEDGLPLNSIWWQEHHSNSVIFLRSLEIQVSSQISNEAGRKSLLSAAFEFAGM